MHQSRYGICKICIYYYLKKNNYCKQSGTSSEESCKPAQEKPSQINESLYSLYKESQGTDEYFSFENEHSSYQERSQIKKFVFGYFKLFIEMFGWINLTTYNSQSINTLLFLRKRVATPYPSYRGRLE